MIRTTCPSALILICLSGIFSGLGISVWQTPGIVRTKEGANENITCHIKPESKAERIMVLWLKDNQTEAIYHSSYLFPTYGSVCINVTLHLQSIHLNHSGIYYCKAWTDLPILGPDEYGNGTYVYVVSTSTLGTTPAPTNPNVDTVMWSLLSGLCILLLIICIACVSQIYNKGHHRSEHILAKDLADAASGSQCPVTAETVVVYTALNFPKTRDSVKTRNENYPAPTTVTCTEDSVTYSKVNIKRGPKDEG
ncbi:uncharacterized protein LOC127414778 isoform X2 [Myxocyprinus asiaticus]|uniref:uncharacterized protein LOC127414778 isoform X2 n=1 Tax=Myxocyprinus asiaticus TaxID=70543 RepID=UPI002223C370|nr:uncharacterized protein LOC127414778 isoform X2 [Myxocyprinus asiaticus]